MDAIGESTRRRTTRNSQWLPVGIVALAAALRLWGIGFGLPYIYHPDEPTIVTVAQRIFQTGDLNPHFFHYPSLPFYLNLPADALYYLTGRLTGTLSRPADIPAPTVLVLGVGQTAAPGLWLLERLITAALGSACAALVFGVGRRLSGSTKAGLIAAAMMAVSPTNVAQSRLTTPDTFAVFFVLLSFRGTVRVFREGRAWQYILAGAGAGLAASSKYNVALILTALIAAHFLRHGLDGFRRRNVYLAVFVSGVAFLVTTPYALLDARTFLADLQFEVRHYATGHAGMEGEAIAFYVTYLWQTEGPLVLFAVAEILHGIYARSKPVVLLSVFPAMYFVLIGSQVVRNDRTLMPLMPFVFLLAGSMLAALIDRAASRHTRWARAAALGALALLVVPLAQTVDQTIRLTTIDSRETGRVWIENHLPVGARIAIESYTPFVDPHRFSVQPFSALIEHTPEWYASNGFEYLVFGQGMFGRYYLAPEHYAREVSQYEDLFHAFERVETFTDGGYEVRIYRVKR